MLTLSQAGLAVSVTEAAALAALLSVALLRRRYPFSALVVVSRPCVLE